MVKYDNLQGMLRGCDRSGHSGEDLPHGLHVLISESRLLDFIIRFLSEPLGEIDLTRLIIHDERRNWTGDPPHEILLQRE